MRPSTLKMASESNAGSSRAGSGKTSACLTMRRRGCFVFAHCGGVSVKMMTLPRHHGMNRSMLRNE